VERNEREERQWPRSPPEQKGPDEEIEEESAVAKKVRRDLGLEEPPDDGMIR
jgi:hypothetical protein